MLSRVRQSLLRPARSAAISSATGLFGHPALQQPSDWQKLAAECIHRSDALVESVQLSPPSASTIRTLDDISDIVCQVFDSAEFCRNVHSSPDWRAQAGEAVIKLAGYVQHLNTHSGLYTSLVQSLKHHQRHVEHAHSAGVAPDEAANRGGAASTSAPAVEGYTREALRVGRALQRDFERCGVHLDGPQRQRLATLTDTAQRLGMQIGQNLADPRLLNHVDVPASQAHALRLLPHSVQRMLKPLHSPDTVHDRKAAIIANLMTQLQGLPAGYGARLDTTAPVVHSVLRYVDSEDIRKQVFMAGYSSPQQNVELIEQLIAARHELAQVMGSPSFAHYQTGADTLAANPEAVKAFLGSLSAALHPKAQQEMQMLREFKARDSSTSAEKVAVHAWDRQYYTGKAKAQAFPGNGAAVSDYLSLQRCIEGLGILLERLMGLSVRLQPVPAGEGWADGLQKMTLVHPAEGILGCIYLDLHPRPGKFVHAAHFNLRCGRRLGDGAYQEPLVALVCNFPAGAGALLSHAEAETLFHEFGHALNSLLSRTKFQHFAGTRGTMDIVEVPSHVMEFFMRDARTLRLFARHYRTGDPMPPAMVDRLQASRRMFSGLDLEQQVLYSLIDQELFGANPPAPGTSTERVAELYAAHSSVRFVPGTCPQARVSHLVGYGATYYSYSYASCLASAFWRTHLEEDPLSRSAGEVLRRQLMEPGGALEPHEMVAGLVGSGAVQSLAGGWAPQPNSMLAYEGISVVA
ncbi:hypothetical protein WJX72_007664 [[Myrmecia] bisecta]|uniref:Peptidase M3A/M3B catalytic domain-containing protein n=1 Tax=[Myrmecia] bisecta TaxID=41462 RepID=A0AAW1QFM9_9CHLO